jgi:N-methylhydantoinase A
MMVDNEAEPASSFRLGVDVGGTFTDLTPFDTVTGEILGYKVPTVAANLAQGVRQGLQELAGAANFDIAPIEYFVHGTTIGLNALFERQGARLGLLVT